MLFKLSTLFFVFVVSQISLRSYYTYLLKLDSIQLSLLLQKKKAFLLRDYLRETTEESHAYFHLESLLKKNQQNEL